MTSEELRVEYHRLVDNKVFSPHDHYPWLPHDADLLHRFVDEHIDHMERVFNGEHQCSAADELIGKVLLGLLEKEVQARAIASHLECVSDSGMN